MKRNLLYTEVGLTPVYIFLRKKAHSKPPCMLCYYLGLCYVREQTVWKHLQGVVARYASDEDWRQE